MGSRWIKSKTNGILIFYVGPEVRLESWLVELQSTIGIGAE